MLSNRMRRGWLGLAVFALIASTVSRADAGLVYLSGSKGELETYNTTTNVVKSLGNTGTVLFDIAVTTNGTLYGVDGTSNLYTVSTSGNGALTTIGSTGAFLNALAGTSSSTEPLVGAGGSQVYTVSTSTGLATATSSTLGGSYSSSGDLAQFGGKLYLTATGSGSTSDVLLSINKTTGAGTAIGSGLGVTGVFGLAASGGDLYGFSGSSVYTVDVTTGAATIVANVSTGIMVDGAASIPPIATPEPATLVSMGIGGLCTLGAFYRKRRRLVA